MRYRGVITKKGTIILSKNGKRSECIMCKMSGLQVPCNITKCPHAYIDEDAVYLCGLHLEMKYFVDLREDSNLNDIVTLIWNGIKQHD